MQNMGKLPQHLIRRGHVWQIRIRVPQEIRHILGKTEIYKSLKTGDLDLAIEQYWQIVPKYKNKIAEAKRQVSPDVPQTLTKFMAQEYAVEWFVPLINRSIEEVLNSLGAGINLERLEELSLDEAHFLSEHEEVVMPTLQATADEILVANGFPILEPSSGGTKRRRMRNPPNVDKKSDGYWCLVEMVRRGELENIRRSMDALDSKALNRYFDPAFQAATHHSNSNVPSRSQAITVCQIIEKYMALDTSLDDHSITRLEARYRPLMEIVGKHSQVSNLTYKDFEDVFLLLKRMPPNPYKSNANKKKSLLDIVKVAEISGAKTLSAASINKYMFSIVNLIEWAAKHDYVSPDLATKIKGLRAKRNKADTARNARNAFSYRDLNTIFSSKVFLEPAVNEPSFYWAPLLSLYHGMRMEEILQLVAGDLVDEDGVSFLQLHDDEGNHLKNSNAKRRVPLHPIINQYRFDTLVRCAEHNQNRKLFPDVPRGSEGKYSNVFTKRYSRHLIRIGAKRPKTSFHSFRHSWRDACSNCQVPDDRVCSIGGWEYGSGTQGIYGSGIDLKELDKAIQMIEYPQVDFSNVKIIDWSKG